MKIPKLYTLEEVAEITRASRSTVNYWVYSQRIATIKVGRRRLVPEMQLLAFLNLGTLDHLGAGE